MCLPGNPARSSRGFSLPGAPRPWFCLVLVLLSLAGPGCKRGVDADDVLDEGASFGVPGAPRSAGDISSEAPPIPKQEGVTDEGRVAASPSAAAGSSGHEESAEDGVGVEEAPSSSKPGQSPAVRGATDRENGIEEEAGDGAAYRGGMSLVENSLAKDRAPDSTEGVRTDASDAPLQSKLDPQAADREKAGENALSTEPSSNRTATEWFRLGVEAYLSENWAECTRALENAIIEWQHFRRTNIECRLRCSSEARAAPPLLALEQSDDDVADLQELRRGEELVRATLCLIKCKRKSFQGRATTDNLPASDRRAFRDLKPYEYLHLCYYQGSQLQKAASAVFTVLSHDPDNELMRHNLKFYLSSSDVDDKNVVNFESKKYASLFLSGVDAYFSEDYDTAIRKLEASISQFLQSVSECRADCEGPFDQGWFPDFTSSVANHFVFCLKCKAKCPSQLSQINGEKYSDFLPLHYNYLQFAYFKKGKLQEACAAAATYLMFNPADETMLENMEYYRSLPKFKSTVYSPRSEAIAYVKRNTYEDLLLKYISDEFVFEEANDKKDAYHSEEIGRVKGHEEPSFKTLALDDLHAFPIKFETTIEDTDKVLKDAEIRLDAKEKIVHPATQNLDQEDKTAIPASREKENLPLRVKLSVDQPIFDFHGVEFFRGTKRFMVDGLADSKECQEMIQFTKASGVKGDGYDGNKSPHSPQELFQGVTLGRAALMVYYGLIDLTTLRLFLNLSERGKNVVGAYFNISRHDLHFSFTHLVCRSSLKKKNKKSYFSHEIHADNCLLQRDGVCVRGHPAYFWRDYSALLYLNEDFEGGEFIFSSDASGNHIESSIKPTCGRLVGFSSGKENLHGVQSVQHGSRCALALWFTLDPNRKEWGRQLTEKMIHHFELGENPHRQLIEDLKDLVQFDLREAQIQVSQIFSNAKSQQCS